MSSSGAEGTNRDRAFEAVKGGDLDALRGILASDPSLASARDEQGLSLVLQAAYRGRDDMIAAVLAAGPELDLFESSALGETDRVRALLDADASDLVAWSVDGFTPLHLAVFFGHARTARLLLERGADVRAVSRNPMKVMPLHSAAAGRSRDSVEAVLDGGAEIDTPSHGGFTALHDAAQNGDRDIVDLLLQRGADRALADDRGRTAATLALEHAHQEVADLLAGSD